MEFHGKRPGLAVKLCARVLFISLPLADGMLGPLASRDFILLGPQSNHLLTALTQSSAFLLSVTPPPPLPGSLGETAFACILSDRISVTRGGLSMC